MAARTRDRKGRTYPAVATTTGRVGAGLAPARDDAGLAAARRMLPALFLLAVALGGCRQDMHDQPKYEPLEESSFFSDGVASRQPVPGTVARGELREDDHLYRGVGADGELATTLPMAATADLMHRGRERYDIFCSPCHGRTGNGQGMIVRRGFKQPETFHQSRLRDVPIGYFFQVMTVGFGQMSDYRAQVPVADRWAIAAYVRALQLSRNAPVDALEARDLEALENLAAASAPAAADHAGHESADDAGGHG